MGSNTSRFAGDVQDLGQDSRKLDEEVDQKSQKSVHSPDDAEATGREKEELNPSLVGEREERKSIAGKNENLQQDFQDYRKASKEDEREERKSNAAKNENLLEDLQDMTEKCHDRKASKEGEREEENSIAPSYEKLLGRIQEMQEWYDSQEARFQEMMKRCVYLKGLMISPELDNIFDKLKVELQEIDTRRKQLESFRVASQRCNELWLNVEKLQK